MGEAKQRAKLRDAAAAFSKPLSRARFNLYAIGTRGSGVAYIAEELSWWASHDERLIAMVSRDKIDNDYSWVMMARDAIGRFRCVNLRVSYASKQRAEDGLRAMMADTVQTEDLITLGLQGDETNAPIDLLRLPTDADPATLHPYFRELLESPARAPGRAVVKEIGPWLTPNDPHLVQEFQNKGFDQRLWEIYLWAALREFGLDIEQLEAPDFRCRKPGVDFTVEATTAAPSAMGPLAVHPEPQGIEETVEFLDDYMPIKYGSALNSKLNKTNKQGLHYWERDESKDKPFLLAIADFHKPAVGVEMGSMTYTQSALWQYLYGQRISWEYQEDRLIITPEPIGDHTYGAKTIPSGFYDQPMAENVSAVLFSNAGTIAKFDRMGVAAGFATPNTGYLRMGFRSDPNPDSPMGVQFVDDVTAPGYEEWWTEEIQVFHNPKAKHPLPFDWLPGAIHHFLEDGLLKSFAPIGTVLSSYTLILQPKADMGKEDALPTAAE
jgi:hypothetical protein